MKKEDLKLCDVVETRNGDLHILLKGDFNKNELAFMDVKTGCYFSFDSYDNNLCDRYGIKEFDVMKVKHFIYSGNAFQALGMIENCKKEELDWDWIRPEPYNAKIVCVESLSSHFTKGKIYFVRNGYLYDKDKQIDHSSYANIDEINDCYYSQLIELVED